MFGMLFNDVCKLYGNKLERGNVERFSSFYLFLLYCNSTCYTRIIMTQCLMSIAVKWSLSTLSQAVGRNELK